MRKLLSLRGSVGARRSKLVFAKADCFVGLRPPRNDGFVWLLLFFFAFNSPLAANEVFEETPAKVIVRNHPKTGKPYAVITENENVPLLTGRPAQRPDYRLLDPNIKASTVPYEGPYSDRKKVYIFAASMATVGAVSGAAVIAAAPAATGAGAAGGAGIYAGAGVGVAAGTAAGTVALTKSKPEDEDIQQTSASREITGKDLDPRPQT